MIITRNKFAIDRVPSLGEKWANGSLLWHGRAGNGPDVTVRSPIDRTPIQTVSMLSPEELDRLVSCPASAMAISDSEFRAFCERLYTSLEEYAAALEDAMIRETAFIRSDCQELMSGSLCYVRDFMSSAAANTPSAFLPFSYSTESTDRQIRCLSVPWGTVAVVLPHNAFLLVALTCMLNALRTGNRIILRAPQQSARSASILAAAIEKADPPPNAVSVVSAPAKEFLEALYHSENPCLIHYMGSSAHAPSILSKAFQNRKSVIIDGQGNGWIYVADDACIETAVRVLSQGAIRYNGQTCTSVNGAIIAPGIFPIIRDRLQVIWDNMSYGNPLVEDVQVGLLFDNVQAANCVELIQSSNGKILSGGHCIDNLLQPTLVESPEQDSLLVTEGVFGCVLWISPGTEEDFISCWNRNRYPLCAGIISDSSNSRRLQMSLGNLARLTVNGDPSNEYLFEPWGAYPGSGLNSVSLWSTKYQRVVQVDEPSAPPRKESNGLIH